MLMFCLPMIILEAMLEAHTNAANRIRPACILDVVPVRERRRNAEVRHHV